MSLFPEIVVLVFIDLNTIHPAKSDICVYYKVAQIGKLTPIAGFQYVITENR